MTKTITTKIENQAFTFEWQDIPVRCDYTECRKKGRVYCCYTLDFRNCHSYVPNQMEARQWNQL